MSVIYLRPLNWSDEEIEDAVSEGLGVLPKFLICSLPQ